MKELIGLDGVMGRCANCMVILKTRLLPAVVGLAVDMLLCWGSSWYLHWIFWFSVPSGCLAMPGREVNYDAAMFLRMVLGRVLGSKVY